MNGQTSAAAAEKHNSYEHLPDNHPRHLIPSLCRQFYALKWVTGTGGGVAMKYDDCYYLAPSGVQKERITAEDLFVLREPTDEEQQDPTINTSNSLLPDTPIVTVSSPPASKRYTASQCTPLFFSAFSLRQAACCIHTHSQAAVLITLLYQKEFKITHQEMIKGIRIGSTKNNYQFYDTLRIPIIENTVRIRQYTFSSHADDDNRRSR